jgi:hypothetical protein
MPPDAASAEPQGDIAADARNAKQKLSDPAANCRAL